MPPSRSRYVSACQHLLVLGVVAAALAPAAGVVSLDVVGVAPHHLVVPTASRGAMSLSAYARESRRTSRVPTGPVDPVVREVSLTAPAATPGAARRAVVPVQATERTSVATGRTRIVSTPQAVHGYGTVGVTWAHGTVEAEDQIGFQVRTLDHGAWSAWQKMDYHDDHGPDPGSAEAAHARPGTDEDLVGNVDSVQVRIDVHRGSVPADMRLAVIDPGHAAATRREAPAIDTATLDGGAATATGILAGASGRSSASTLSARTASPLTSVTPKPVIYSRAQWGADESMRDPSSLHYGSIHGGFVHHTVNANNYKRSQVPALLRSIYAYHVRSRGWSDIGYNFLVDRFGRIWEGRYGGVDRPVVGAHTLNYNDDSFAMSAIGNYDIARPSTAMLQAYGALFAWKLSLHGVDAGQGATVIEGTTFAHAINGHRDAAPTACPGRYLYAQLPTIRAYAAAAQASWAGRQRQTDLAGSHYPDLIARRISDDRGVIITTGGLVKLGKPAAVSTGWSGAGTVVSSPDLTGDGKTDLLVVGPTAVNVRPGDGKGGFGAAVPSSPGLLGHDLVTAVGDLNGDRKKDVVARSGATLDVFLGRGDGTFRAPRAAPGSWSGYDLLAASGDLTGDGRRDLVARDTAGHLWIVPGTGTGSFGTPVAVGGSWGGFDTITGFGDFDGDHHRDLVVRRTSDGLAYVMPGDGHGGFLPPRGPLRGLRGLTQVTGGGNIAGSKAPDLVGLRGGSLLRLVNPGTKDLGRTITTNLDLTGANRVINVGDWDRDGFGDVVVRLKNGQLLLYRGDGTGQFAPAVTLGTGFDKVDLLAAVGDVTGDGYPDLMGQPHHSSMRIYPGAGTAGLGVSYPAAGSLSGQRQIGIGLWNNNGAPDVAIKRGSTLTMYAGNGPGGLIASSPMPVDLSPYNWFVGIGDTGITGHADLVVRARSDGSLWLLPGTPTGFAPARRLGGGMQVYDLVG